MSAIYSGKRANIWMFCWFGARVLSLNLARKLASYVTLGKLQTLWALVFSSVKWG